MPTAFGNYKPTAECCSQASVPRGDTVLHLRLQCTQVVESFGSGSSLQLGDSKTALAAAAELESALVEHVYSSPHTALGHLQAAGTALGMQTTVEGQLSLCSLTDLQFTYLTDSVWCAVYCNTCKNLMLLHGHMSVFMHLQTCVVSYPVWHSLFFLAVHGYTAQVQAGDAGVCDICFFCVSSGAMGMRTVHQVDPKAQLVVLTSHTAQDDCHASGEDSAALDAMSLGSQAESPELKGLTTESDVLSAPRLVDESGAVVERPLGGLEQAVLLGWAQQVKKGTSADELQVWELCDPSLPALVRSPHIWIHSASQSTCCCCQSLQQKLEPSSSQVTSLSHPEFFHLSVHLSYCKALHFERQEQRDLAPHCRAVSAMLPGCGLVKALCHFCFLMLVICCVVCMLICIQHQDIKGLLASPVV